MLTEEQKAEIQREIDSRIEALLSAGSENSEILQREKVTSEELVRLASLGREGHEKFLRALRERQLQLEAESKWSRRLIDLKEAWAGQSTSKAPLESLVRVVARAVEVLGTSEKALRWINAPVRSLGNQTPVSLLDSPEGIKRVEDSLGRIEHGVW